MTRREKKKKKLDAQKKKLSFMPPKSPKNVTPIHHVTTGKPSNQNPKASNNIA
jgi:hypothetical protein